MYVRRISTLDIEITILNSHFHSKVFDKQESFNFRIVDFHLDRLTVDLFVVVMKNL